jgi:hypothetical protein
MRLSWQAGTRSASAPVVETHHRCPPCKDRELWEQRNSFGGHNVGLRMADYLHVLLLALLPAFGNFAGGVVAELDV